MKPGKLLAFFMLPVMVIGLTAGCGENPPAGESLSEIDSSGESNLLACYLCPDPDNCCECYIYGNCICGDDSNDPNDPENSDNGTTSRRPGGTVPGVSSQSSTGNTGSGGKNPSGGYDFGNINPEDYRGKTVRLATWKDPKLNPDGPVVEEFKKKYEIGRAHV